MGLPLMADVEGLPTFMETMVIVGWCGVLVAATVVISILLTKGK